MTTCPVTIHLDIPPVPNGDRGERTTKSQPCDMPIVRDGLCAKHLADKERLS